MTSVRDVSYNILGPAKLSDAVGRNELPKGNTASSTKSSEDAAVLTLSNNVRYEIGDLNGESLKQQENASSIQISEEALGKASEILDRMSSLAATVNADEYEEDYVAQIAGEMEELEAQVDEILAQAQLNGHGVWSSSNFTLPIFGNTELGSALSIAVPGLGRISTSLSGNSGISLQERTLGESTGSGAIGTANLIIAMNYLRSASKLNTKIENGKNFIEEQKGILDALKSHFQEISEVETEESPLQLSTESLLTNGQQAFMAQSYKRNADVLSLLQ